MKVIIYYLPVCLSNKCVSDKSVIQSKNSKQEQLILWPVRHTPTRPKMRKACEGFLVLRSSQACMICVRGRLLCAQSFHSVFQQIKKNVCGKRIMANYSLISLLVKGDLI